MLIDLEDTFIIAILTLVSYLNHRLGFIALVVFFCFRYIELLK